ncbi:MAG: PilZ domain-containing protein [Myxococcales bacterium]|nr:PilZ domain-containing protein [Myxococcales bacterium]
MSDNEKRAHQRLEVNREFESVDDFVTEYVTNISRGGVFIRSKNPLPPGTEVNLKFSIVSDDFQMIEGVGRVVRIDETPENMGMGVLFTQLSAESEEAVNLLADRIEARLQAED